MRNIWFSSRTTTHHSHRLRFREHPFKTIVPVRYAATATATAVFFPGQATESQGMLAPLLHHFPTITRDGLDALSEALNDDPELPTIIRLLTTKGDDDGDDDKRLVHRTAIAQPCILLSSIMTWRILRDQCAGLNSGDTVYFGHSLGQITAFAAAGAIHLVDALKIVRQRGLAMEQVISDTDISTPSKYGMLAVPIKQPIAEFAASMRDCEQKLRSDSTLAPDQVIDLANLNSPGQVVLSGHIAALNKLAAEMGLRRSTNLPVRIPFHSRLLRGVESRLRDAVNTAAVTMPPQPPPPAARFLRNSDAQELTTADDIRKSIVSGCWEPVDWVRSVRRVEDWGVNRWIGVGPGSAVTTALVKRSLITSVGHDIVTCDPMKTGTAWDTIVAAL
ncbi:acyl transferase/acyl hydrolase/lysophospholipase [Lipomyces chichibuensis]|uniref:acyl transferase/acyl hydrolase/lysophospholipase n=1 Tax=Lipomyces chichibuensis TaxID=1546026 RepID=UPI0033443215